MTTDTPTPDAGMPDEISLPDDLQEALNNLADVDPLDLAEQWARECAHLRGKISSIAAWQPIQTAPHDEAVLLYACGLSIGHFNSAYGQWWGYDGAKHFASWNQPTHWLPLPLPPHGTTGERHE